MDQLIALNPDEFSRFTERMEVVMIKEIGKIAGVMVEAPMKRKEAARFCKCSLRTFDRLLSQGIVKPNRLGKTPMFFATELVEAIKKTKKGK